MIKRARCAMCENALPAHGFYLVRMDVFAEPSVPPVNTEDLDEQDTQEVISQLIRQLEKMDPDDAQDHVHRRFEYAICGDCQRELLINPLGKPRRARQGDN